MIFVFFFFCFVASSSNEIDVYYRSDEIPERMFRGKVRVSDGDQWTPELADQSSLAFLRGSKFYQNGINAIIDRSDLKQGFLKSEILALDG